MKSVLDGLIFNFKVPSGFPGAASPTRSKRAREPGGVVHSCFPPRPPRKAGKDEDWVWRNKQIISSTLLKVTMEPWLVWLSGLSTGLRRKRSPVRFPVRTHAWVAGQVPSKGCARGNHALMFLSLSFSLFSSL